MGKASPPVKLKKSWISEHPFVVIGVILTGCLGPFINKAINGDEMLYVWTAEWIQKHPVNFFGLEVNMYGSTIPMWVGIYNPPLISYFLAGVAALFGWHEMVLHLASLVVAFAAAAGIYALAQMWCDRPLLATVVAIFTPAFLVCSTTLTCDVLMLTFWIWALVCWERALASQEHGWWRFAGAGLLAGLAMLTKYSALLLLPLLPVLSLLRTRKSGWWLLGLAVPLAMIAGYEWLTARLYGRGLLFGSAGSVQTHGNEYPGGWEAKGIVGLAFAGGSLLPLLFFAPWLWRRWTLLAVGVVILGISLGICRFGSNLGLLLPWEFPGLLGRRYFWLQVGVLTAAGVHLLLLVGAEAWRRRNVVSVMLILWILSGLFFWTMVNVHLGARRFLPIVPAAAILLVRRREATRGNAVTWGVLWPLIPAAAITLSVAVADYQMASSARTAAEQIAAGYKPKGHKLWFAGGYGTFQYYMEKLGGQRIDIERSLLQPGDIVVVPWLRNATVVLPRGGVGWLGGLPYRPYFWMNPYGDTESTAAGFYGADSGPVPFAIGRLPGQVYYVVKVFSAVQYRTLPANWREVQAGGMPSFPSQSCSIEGNPSYRLDPEAERTLQLASQSKADGKIEEAIQHCREALDKDSNNPVALNNLAWILASASKPELRNGKEAVQLATRAVELTDYREPLFILTLAIAYAEAGDFSRAAGTANTANALAQLTRQNDIAEKSATLLTLYISGKRTNTAYAP